MLLLRKPSPEAVCRFLTEQAELDFTYSAVGATATTLPGGYLIDHTRILLGRGEAVFRAGKATLENWQQFNLGWLEAFSRDTPIRAGEVVAVVARAIGLWWLNACRIVYVVDEAGPVTKFGFAYGTLPDHAGSGEERFLIEWNRADDSVSYDILAFSRPQHFLIRLGYPLVRRTQKRFGRESGAAMLKAVNGRASLNLNQT
ncbi:MAG: DUF1990 family protein [Pirellulaceae bacterium]